MLFSNSRLISNKIPYIAKLNLAKYHPSVAFIFTKKKKKKKGGGEGRMGKKKKKLKKIKINTKKNPQRETLF